MGQRPAAMLDRGGHSTTSELIRENLRGIRNTRGCQGLRNSHLLRVSMVVAYAAAFALSPAAARDSREGKSAFIHGTSAPVGYGTGVRRGFQGVHRDGAFGERSGGESSKPVTPDPFRQFHKGPGEFLMRMCSRQTFSLLLESSGGFPRPNTTS